VADGDEVLGCVLGVDAATVLGERDVELPVEIVLDRPVFPRCLESLLRVRRIERTNVVSRMDLGFGGTFETSFGLDPHDRFDGLPFVAVRDVSPGIEDVALAPLAAAVGETFGLM